MDEGNFFQLAATAMKHGNCIDFPDLQLFHGPFSPMRAELYARIPVLDPEDGCRLEGEVYGPLCESSRTLPARNRLVDAGAGQTVLARAVVTDPVAWTADVPAVYRVRLRLIGGDQVLAEQERTFGFLAIGVAAGQLYRAGQAWVLRAVHGPDDPQAVPWDELRAAELALVASRPSDELCQAATVQGVPVVALLDSIDLPLADEIRRLSRTVSVAAIVLPASNLPFDPHELAPGLLFGQELTHRPDDTPPAAWADLLLVDSTALETMSPSRDRDARAVLVQYRRAATMGIERSRELLQQLQEAAAKTGSFAGYLIRAT